MRTSANSTMEDEKALEKKKPRKLSKAFKKLRQRLHTHTGKVEKEFGERQKESSKFRKEPCENDEGLRENERESRRDESELRDIDEESGKNEKEPEVDQSRPKLPSSTAGGPKAIEDEEPAPKPWSKAPHMTVKNEAEESTPNPSPETLQTEAKEVIPPSPKALQTEAKEPTPATPKTHEAKAEEPALNPQTDTPSKTLKTEAEEPVPNLQTDVLSKTVKTEDRNAGIKLSNIVLPSAAKIKSTKERDSANRKAPIQAGAVEPPAVTHTSSDGSISYFNSASTARNIEKPFTTPGYEWASRSRGYDWDSRRAIYGGNLVLGEHYERTMRQRSEALEKTYQKVEAEREQPIKVKATGARTMIASGYWAGTEA